MAILDAFIPTATADLVSILDADGNQVFETASPLKASLSPEIKYMTHPVETGGNITDHRIILPDVVTVSLVLEAGKLSRYVSTDKAVRAKLNAANCSD